jgi:hypothetical protein
MRNQNPIFHKASQKNKFNKKVEIKMQKLKVQKRNLKKKKIKN